MRLSFRPRPGARFAYRVVVHAETVTDVPGQPERHNQDDFTLRADDLVVAASAAASRVQVKLTAEGEAPRSYLVALDRAAQLSTIEQVEGLPTAVLGELSLAEIFPAAAGAPPDRPLRPASRWRVDKQVQLPGAAPVRLTGRGRLVSLEVRHNRTVATVETTSHLPVSGTTGDASAPAELRGAVDAETTTTYALADGAVERAVATATGRYRVTLLPPPGRRAPPIEGTLTVIVHSTTDRLS